MKQSRVIGIVLLVLGILVITGLFIDDAKYWYPIDYVTIAVCVISSFLLLKEK